MITDVIDPIDLEVLRSRLEAVGEQACRTVEQTAVSPSITESKDYSVTLMDGNGELIVGSGPVIYHYGAAAHAVQSTLARYRGSICPGDVFLANDPHNGGGLHPQDVMLQQPIFVKEDLVAWVGVSAHMMDMGGMVIGSFAPDATECYQEAFRIPPVRLFKAGAEVSEVWDLLRTNIRMAQLVEMDLRGLVAGAHHATERIQQVIGMTGIHKFAASLAAIRNLSEAQLRRRIRKIADGTYRATSWTEYHLEFYKVPCTLTVLDDHLTFDFEGASPQCKRFFNSKPHIIAAELVVMLANRLAPDLPFNAGLFAPITIRCPEGSIVNASPPAPIAAAHMHVGLNAAGVAMQALVLALGASPDAEQHQFLGGASWDSALATQLWSWTNTAGEQDAFLALDGLWAGSSAGSAIDGNDLGREPVGPAVEGSFPDIEVLESWYPLLFIERRSRSGASGAGQYRAGAGNQFSFRPHGISHIVGTVFGMRRWLPLQGVAGGRPGACNEMLVHHADGSVTELDLSCSGITVGPDEWYEMRLASGGGFGDPLDRVAAAVERDLVQGRLNESDGRSMYGVESGDPIATVELRDRMRRERLDRAQPAKKPFSSTIPSMTGDPVPLFPGIVQHGGVAVAAASGTPLAVSPDHWTDGCPTIVERIWGDEGPDVFYRTWLDPKSGRSLHVEAVVGYDERSFEVMPTRWCQAAVRLT
jgi:N-methylhydantoinase B